MAWSTTPTSWVWTSISSDLTGMKLVRSSPYDHESDQGIELSTDGGDNWTNIAGTFQSGNSNYKNVYISGDGNTIVIDDGGSLYKTTDNGVSWGPNFAGVNQIFSMSNDGQVMVISGLFISLDGGNSSPIDATTAFGSPAFIYDAVVTGDGTKVIVASKDGVNYETAYVYIYDIGLDSWSSISTGYILGGLFTAADEIAGAVHIRSNLDGSSILISYYRAGAGDSVVLYSTNSGSTWTSFVQPKTYSSLALSEDGSTALVGFANSGSVYLSTDGGNNWITQTDLPPGTWGQAELNGTKLAINNDGTKLYAVKGYNYYELEISNAITIIDENNSTVTTPTTWGDGATLDVTVPAVVQPGATLTLDVPSIAVITGAGSIIVEPGASISITGPTGTRTMTVEQGHRYKLDPSNT